MTLVDLNGLSPADHNGTPWVATPDGSWTRLVGAGVNPDMPRPAKKGGAGTRGPQRETKAADMAAACSAPTGPYSWHRSNEKSAARRLYGGHRGRLSGIYNGKTVARKTRTGISEQGKSPERQLRSQSELSFIGSKICTMLRR
jgi:hypothetical protein